MANHNPPKNGLDKRPTAINKKGRPRSFDAWRELAKEIMSEPASGKDGLVLIKIPMVKDGKPVFDDNGQPVLVDHYATNAEMVARSWLRDPKRQQALTEAAYGKVPQALAVTGADGGAVEVNHNIIRIVRDDSSDLAKK